MISRSLHLCRLWLRLLLLLELCRGQHLPPVSIDPEGFAERAISPGMFVVGFCVAFDFVLIFDHIMSSLRRSEPCIKFRKELILAAESLSKTSNVSIYEVDCAVHEKLCASLDVVSFPTIRTFEHQKWERYRGPQKAMPLVTHVLKKVIKPLAELDEERFSVMKNLEIPLIVLTAAEDDDSSIHLLAALASNELAEYFFVGVMTVTQSTTKVPFITVYNIQDETTPKYDGPFEKKSILHFASLVSQPLIRPFDMSSLVSFMKSGLPIGILYSAIENERKTIAASLFDVAIKYRGKVNFATVDAIKNPFTLEPMGIQPDQLPAFVIQTNEDVFKFGPGLTITSEALDVFIGNSLFSVSMQPDQLVVQQM